jgi:hypothetical protein
LYDQHDDKNAIKAVEFIKYATAQCRNRDQDIVSAIKQPPLPGLFAFSFGREYPLTSIFQSSQLLQDI